MKLTNHLAWSIALAAVVAGCGGGGGGSAASAGSGGSSYSVPACATNTSKGWLTDYTNTPGNPKKYDQAVQGCVDGLYTGQALNFPNTTVFLTGNNIKAMVDASNQLTDGNAPTFAFYIDTPSPSLPATNSTIELAITKGVDSIRVPGESQVQITLAVVTQLEGSDLVMRSGSSQTVDVNAITSDNTNILNGANPFHIAFTGSDVIARASSAPGGMVLTINAFGLLTKIYDSAQAGDLDAQTLLLALNLGQYPTAGNYTFSIKKTAGSDLPLKTVAHQQINSLSIGLPIQ
ncbi:MAG: hypothetical protein ACOYB2_04950 [Limnohabitans sp.]